jgi:hypothetical protein
MKAAGVQTRNTFQESRMVREGLDMKAEMGKTRVRISEALGDSIATRFFRVVALATLLVGTAALYSSMSQGEAGSRPASSAAFQDIEVEELEAPVIGIAAYGSSETTRALPDTAYLGSQDPEVAERVLDEVRQAFIGIPSSSIEVNQAVEVEELEAPVIGVPAYSYVEINQASQTPTYWVQRDEAEEMLFDEVRQAFIGEPRPVTR